MHVDPRTAPTHIHSNNTNPGLVSFLNLRKLTHIFPFIIMILLNCILNWLQFRLQFYLMTTHYGQEVTFYTQFSILNYSFYLFILYLILHIYTQRCETPTLQLISFSGLTSFPLLVFYFILLLPWLKGIKPCPQPYSLQWNTHKFTRVTVSSAVLSTMEHRQTNI